MVNEKLLTSVQKVTVVEITVPRFMTPEEIVENSDELSQIVYLSKVSDAPASDQLLDEIGEKCFWKNWERQISGILVTDRLHFIQLLEGPQGKIAQLVEAISKDKRHHSICIVSNRVVEKRLYGKWGLGIADVKEQTEEQKLLLKEIRQMFTEDIESSSAGFGEKVIKYLGSFRLTATGNPDPLPDEV